MLCETRSIRFMALNNNTLIFTKENAFENVVCTIWAFWYRYKYARTIAPRFTGFAVTSIILQQSSIGLDDGFAHAPNHIRTNDSLVYWRIYLSLGYDMLSYPLGITRCPKLYLLSSHKNVLTSKRFPHYCPLVRGTLRSPAGYPYNRPVIPSFDVFIVVRLGKLSNKQ